MRNFDPIIENICRKLSLTINKTTLRRYMSKKRTISLCFLSEKKYIFQFISLLMQHNNFSREKETRRSSSMRLRFKWYRCKLGI